jgi:hypothetical protein
VGLINDLNLEQLSQKQTFFQFIENFLIKHNNLSDMIFISIAIFCNYIFFFIYFEIFSETVIYLKLNDLEKYIYININYKLYSCKYKFCYFYDKQTIYYL